MTSSDRETLQGAPLWATVVVMDVMEGKANPVAVMALTDGLMECAASGEGLAQEVCMSILEAFQTAKASGQAQPELLATVLKGNVPAAYAGLMEVGKVLDEEAPDEALKFKLAVNQIARKVVDSYGGGSFLRRGNKQAEKAMRSLGTYLGVGEGLTEEERRAEGQKWMRKAEELRAQQERRRS